MKKERIMITKMETVGKFTRIFGNSDDAIKMTRTAFVIAKGSVMHV